RHLNMRQTLSLNDLDNFRVQMASQLDLRSGSRSQPQRPCQFRRSSRHDRLSSLHRVAPLAASSPIPSRTLESSGSFSQMHEKPKSPAPIWCSTKLESFRCGPGFSTLQRLELSTPSRAKEAST